MRYVLVTLIFIGLLCLGITGTAVAEPMIRLDRLSWEEMINTFKKRARETGFSNKSIKDLKNKKKDKSRGSMFMSQMFYLYAGSFPDEEKKDAFLQNTHFRLEDPDGSIKGLDLIKGADSYMVAAPNKNGGWYRLTAYNDYGVKNGNRFHLFSQDSFLNHSDEVKRDKTEKVECAGFYKGRPTFEIVRIMEDIRQQYRVEEGDELRVKVLLKGKPLKDVDITLITEKKWRQTIKTDDNGEALFTLIKETFPQGKTDKTKTEKYLLLAEYSVDNPGNYNGQAYEKERYAATMPLRVYPSSLDWESKSTGYLVVMFTILIVSGAAAIRRKRRRKDES